MKSKKILVPYIITIYGNIESKEKTLENIKDDVLKSNINFLISKADSKYVEIDEEKVISQLEQKGDEEN